MRYDSHHLLPISDLIEQNNDNTLIEPNSTSNTAQDIDCQISNEPKSNDGEDRLCHFTNVAIEKLRILGGVTVDSDL
jgi:hypothetical protein